jgi:mRNA-degrading endonuclease toxin of MazEF toxin-antitoxin module
LFPVVGKKEELRNAVFSLCRLQKTVTSLKIRALFCDQVRTVDKGRIQETIGVLGHELLAKVDRGLILHVELEDYVTL